MQFAEVQNLFFIILLLNIATTIPVAIKNMQTKNKLKIETAISNCYGISSLSCLLCRYVTLVNTDTSTHIACVYLCGEPPNDSNR